MSHLCTVLLGLYSEESQILPVDINEGQLAKPLPTDMNDDNTRKALEVLTNNRIKIIESVCFI